MSNIYLISFHLIGTMYIMNKRGIHACKYAELYKLISIRGPKSQKITIYYRIKLNDLVLYSQT